MTAPTPGAQVPNPQPLRSGAQHATGSTIRVVHEPIVTTHCLKATTDERHRCLRLRGHNGGCVAWTHWPQMHITPDNPKWKAAS